MFKYSGILEDLDLNQLREFYGMTIKFILPKKDWDYKGAIALRNHPKKDDFADHPVFVSMIKGFQSKNRSDMELIDDFNKMMKDLVHFNQGLSNPRCKRRTRKKRITQFKKEYTKLLKELRNERKVGQGLTNFSFSIEKQFNLN